MLCHLGGGAGAGQLVPPINDRAYLGDGQKQQKWVDLSGLAKPASNQALAGFFGGVIQFLALQHESAALFMFLSLGGPESPPNRTQGAA